jgi:iron complex outermembrane receptor protein
MRGIEVFLAKKKRGETPMHRSKTNRVRAMLLAGCAAIAMAPAAALAEPGRSVHFSIPAQDLSASLNQFARQSEHQIVFSTVVATGRNAPELRGELAPEQALAMLLAGTDLTWRREGDAFMIVKADADPQSGSAAGGGAEVEALIVTAQKREENIQDVPIAISAFTSKDLEEQKIEGGFDLLKAIPNVTFSKNNFTSYNFSIRGIGTKAVSATTDPGVAVSFNNIALIQNRLFEQEYFDVERVEVLRGPQGTLYGRNATAGVINVISAKPDMDEFKGWLKGEVGNYDAKRLSAMVNVPLVEDVLALRVAGAITQRDGYDFNTFTENPVNGRELWSARVTLGFNPTENIRANLIWERFEEDDNRSRTGKQLCHRDPGPDYAGETDLATEPLWIGYWVEYTPYRKALFSQGCKPVSLYDTKAFDTPNGLALPFVWVPQLMANIMPAHTEDGFPVPIIGAGDPYGGRRQSTDLREISSVRDPIYRAKADLLELNVEVDIGEDLTFFSQTAYNEDQVYSFQDYNRFNTDPIINDTSDWVSTDPWDAHDYSRLAPGGYFCDPQIGCSNKMAGFDISKATAEQFTQELRLQSDFDGPLNFSAGANYTKFDVLADYYVMYNLITMLATQPWFNNSPPESLLDPQARHFPCNRSGWIGEVVGEVDYNDPAAVCPYIDPGSLDTMDGEGHNYFRSKNPYKLTSWAAFGELYWNVSDALKLTAGLRYTDDRKTFIPVPTQVLLSRGLFSGGAVNKGYPESDPIKQHWGEWTGRLGLDWKPDLPWTDDTMVYAFYSRGYKGGGANPPLPGFGTMEDALQQLEEMNADPYWSGPFGLPYLPVLPRPERGYTDTFKPEFVNAFEVGAKNTLLGGALTFNTGAFFYDYKDYQVSQIRDRTAVNENFDAEVWGLEFETMFAPSRNLRVIANLGYLDTKIGDGMKSIDIMNRTQSNPDWMLVKPWLQYPSNCIVPTAVVENWAQNWDYAQSYWTFCNDLGGLLGSFGFQHYDPVLQKPYDPADYPEANGGAGISADLAGNELPNSPHWTMNIGAQYGFEFVEGWRATLRGDAYWQSQSWARVYNAVNDKLHGWYNANLSLWIENDDGLKIEFYAKNILDGQPITDAFINSDDTALTTNVFTLDPRLIGLSIRKEF